MLAGGDHNMLLIWFHDVDVGSGSDESSEYSVIC